MRVVARGAGNGQMRGLRGRLPQGLPDDMVQLLVLGVPLETDRRPCTGAPIVAVKDLGLRPGRLRGAIDGLRWGSNWRGR